MRILAACTSYWNSEAEFAARYSGHWLNRVDPRTGNVAYHLNPEYGGRFGLRAWHQRITWMLKPYECVIACGTWSDPELCPPSLPVKIVNAGVDPDHLHTAGWQYMGCALTALMAHAAGRRDWDLLILLEPDVLIGAINWPKVLSEFSSRPETVFGPSWYDRACDFVGWKRPAVVRYVHCRLRPNLTEDNNSMWLDDELDRMYRSTWWNPWPEVRTTRQDYAHDAGAYALNESAMTWPFVRLPHPGIIERYERECTALAIPMQ